MKPTPSPSFQSNTESVVISATIVSNKVNVVKGKPPDWIETAVNAGSSEPKLVMPTTDLINQGKPKPIRMSNMFEPIELHKAMSANPARFTTSTLEINSGIEVPAAKMVNPLTVSGIPKVFPKQYNKS